MSERPEKPDGIRESVRGCRNARHLERQRAFTLDEVSLLLIATLVASLTKQLAVLLLGHTLAALLNN
jgi:hypothetical protein